MTKSHAVGPLGKRLAEIIVNRRYELHLTKTGLCLRLGDIGRPITLDVLTKIEHGSRHVDVDDLVALVTALDLQPHDILYPSEEALHAG